MGLNLVQNRLSESGGGLLGRGLRRTLQLKPYWVLQSVLWMEFLDFQLLHLRASYPVVDGIVLDLCWCV